MEQRLRDEIECVLRSGQELNVRIDSVTQKLVGAGWAYRIRALPTEFLVHPANRGGLLVNPHDMQQKGCTMLQTGVVREL